MKKIYYLLVLLPLTGINSLLAQEASTGKKVKSVTGYNFENKKKELDHLTNYNKDGLKTDETEYFSDGKIKNKAVFEYDNNKRCIKETRYGPKGKVEKVVLFEYDAAGNKSRENTVNTAKHTRSGKIFEYSFY